VDHLGSERVVISDIKEPNSGLGSGGSEFYTTNISVSNYYPFGSLMSDISRSSEAYRYGYNGKENDDEISGKNAITDYGARTYANRLGRFLSTDPLKSKFPQQSPYVYALNSPIIVVDKDGEVGVIAGLLAKGGTAAVADVMIQIGMNYMLNDDVSSFETAIEMVDVDQVMMSFIEGVNPVSVPGGKNGRAALSAGIDVSRNAAGAFFTGEEYTLEQAGADFLIGYLSEMSTESLDKLLTSKKAKQKFAKLLGNKEWKGPLKYDNLPNPRNAGAGKETTKRQRERLIEYNKKENGGLFMSDEDGTIMNIPTATTKGQKADMKQGEVDHIKPKSKGGTNKNKNLRIITKEQNLRKGNK
jgi:RHS repeat-associated protein